MTHAVNIYWYSRLISLLNYLWKLFSNQISSVTVCVHDFLWLYLLRARRLYTVDRFHEL